MRLVAILTLTVSAAALAQGATPDESWSSPFSPDAGSGPAAPESEFQPPPPRIVHTPGPLSSPPQPVPRLVTPTRPPPPEELNNVSMYGAPSLGTLNRGLGIYMGFPLLGARFALGVTRYIDAGIAFDSMYGVMNDFRLHLKWQIIDGRNWSLAAAAEGGYALFSSSPQAEGDGPRWLTGRRNWNLAPGLILSYRGDSSHAPRLFLDSRCAIAFDTQPYAHDPLGGTPASLQVSPNLTVRAGAEMPFSAKTSFLFVFGFDIHGRPDDAPFMIDVSVGIVTSI